MTQGPYNVSNEVAEHIEYLVGVVADTGRELAGGHVPGLTDIVDKVIKDCRPLIGEFDGLCQALTSGIRSGCIGILPSVSTLRRHSRPVSKSPDIQLLSPIPTSLKHPVTVPTAT